MLPATGITAAEHLIGVAAVSPASRTVGVGWAVVLAVASTGCYAMSAVLQEREAARDVLAPATLILRLVRRRVWWLAVLATVAGAALHVAALALGPLSLIQPLGVLTLVLALPLGARLGGRMVTGREWGAAAAVAMGLAALLAVAPHRVPRVHLSSGAIAAAAAAVVVVVVVALTMLSRHVPGRAAPVVQAAAAATCFGFALAMARVAVTGSASVLIAAMMAVAGAVVGLGLVQLAYRAGGLGAPLATLNLGDPTVAVIIGVTLLGEPLLLTPSRIVLGVVGLVATAVGIGALARPSRPVTRSGPHSGHPGEAGDRRNAVQVVR